MASHLPNVILCGSFLFTGVTNAVLTQIIFYTAPINSSSLLLVFCSYFGYALRYYIPGNSKKKEQELDTKDEEDGEPKTRKQRGAAGERDKPAIETATRKVKLLVFFITLTEIVGSQLATVGFSYVGSGLYQVLYSSIILFTAFVSFFLLKQTIALPQWLALALITVGLMVSAGHVDTGEVPITGVLCVFAATYIFSFTSTSSEVVIQRFDLSGAKYSMLNGAYGSGVIGLYILFVTVPNWKEWISDPIHDSNASSGFVLFLFVILIVGQIARGIAYYNCIEALGSVSTGVLYALQAICMFGLSAILFCNPTAHSVQCFTPSKALGAAVVSGGVALYSLGKKKRTR